MPKTKMAKTSKEARDYISHKIRIMMHEGMSQDEAIARAYSIARKKGFDVPVKKGRKIAKKKMAKKKKSKKSKGKK